ncbi:MAG: FAD-dependent oxidoreductase [Anaerolineae bacterium]|nr:FAD-dependent oxidoreductase [Anaerolineae bacterium]
MTGGRSQSNGTPVGAVLVVGGGIAGMQASLDLAEQGFKVYLAETQSAIGGKMAQLDKTFPTNDCAMCTISPKLVETGRHLNIDILTKTEVMDVRGRPGDFIVRLRHKPRYIDESKCVGCGDCAEVCPVIVPDSFNESLDKRHAAYKLYPQAVPNAYAIEKRGIAPCRDACPAGQRAQGYIALIREGRYPDALRVIKMDNPFPGICGRICNHRCETACNRGLVDEPVNIRALKRFVTDKIYAEPRPPVSPAERTSDRRAAIIGAGPCGLTAAQDLALAGYGVTVFEAMPVAGGMLRLGVPEYRLPTAIIEREVQDIIDLGVDLRLNHQVNNLDDIFDEGFDAVLIAVGAHEGIRLPIPGANLDGVLINTRFLRDVRLGRYTPDGKPADGAPPLGKRVMVLGGGNVAIDVARTAVRLGCEVSMACLESYDQMPAHRWEVEAAEAEGITIYNSRSFERVIDGGGGHVGGMVFQHVASFHFDEGGRLHVEKAPGSEHTVECDTVIFSVGQRAGLAFIPDDAGVGLTERSLIATNPNTLAATREGVFAAGDSVSGTAFVIEAVNSGHIAARSIIRYLQGEHLEPPRRPRLPVVQLSRDEIDARIARGEIKPQPRVPLPELPVEARVSCFAEVEGGYDDASAQAEAARCLACGICSECMSCVFECQADAIDHDMVERIEEVNVGAIILAPGYQVTRPVFYEEYGFGRYPNVVTSIQFERLLSASGPTSGHVRRPSDGAEPHKIAFLQCVGSRDQAHDYCSAVCCMYAAKEAVMAKEHAPETDVSIFMMDMRSFSKGYDAYYKRAQERYGVHYVRCRISEVRQDPNTHDLILHYQTDDLTRREARFDLVVLSVGMEISEEVRDLARRLGVELDDYGFCHTVRFDPLETSRPGIYAVGPFREPKDIPETVIEASGAAASAAGLLAAARGTLTEKPVFPPERDVSGEAPRVGVFVCHCGSNIGGFLDVPGVAEYARRLPHVAHAESNLYTCSQDSIKHITEQIEAHGLNRVIIASCTPITHLSLFQDSARAAGLNPYLVDMANIRNQCSWVHSHDWDAATQKAKDLVRMAVARAARLQPQRQVDVPVNHTALIIGGGAAGMTAALSLADQGFPSHLVERDVKLGGNLRRLFFSQDAERNPQDVLTELVSQVVLHPEITIHTESEVVETKGFVGNFTSVLRTPGGAQTLEHGVTIVATGAQEYRGNEYGYGSHPRILTQQEFELHLIECWADGHCEDLPGSVVMIQCVGPAERYCSRVCCTSAIKNALTLKELKPAAQVVILYKDIRVYGLKEQLYTEARRRGVLFLRYDDAHRPEVETGADDVLTVHAWEPSLGRPAALKPDALVLSMPAVPSKGAERLASTLRVPVDGDGFFLEAHVKLRPVDFASEGIFMAGMAHYPKLLDEAMIQAKAAAARAANILALEMLKAGGVVAEVNPELCTGCLTCVRICPYGVPVIVPDRAGAGGIMGAAYIEPAICQGCGICASECPARAIQVRHYQDDQVTVKIDALFAPDLIQIS